MLSLFYFQIINNPCFVKKNCLDSYYPIEQATDLVFKNLEDVKNFQLLRLLEPGGEYCQA